ncbi:uncharacterized protein ColSpa_05985 [Colletotrichum spaethianum]|uniref:Heterokaryon incompatibility protein n=1 Tax=Colletotrichum spaethianum TaxID=700344 RepID=A0AA37LE96_9PEZI|nr:uncharacterized protein ColSpa_05985 [Colletotrichum spaethianum]GKT45804.1 hypothetical protein ColSpa_05985 [Colletotrichum spaethianum]
MTCEKSQLNDRIDIDLSGPVKSMISGMETWLTSEDPEEAEQARVSFVASAPLVEMTILASATPRRFSHTESDRLCMIPREARVGDMVCIFIGAELPFVIRPTLQGMYEMIGDAYVSGIMDGEALVSGIYDQVEIILE